MEIQLAPLSSFSGRGGGPHIKQVLGLLPAVYMQVCFVLRCMYTLDVQTPQDAH